MEIPDLPESSDEELAVKAAELLIISSAPDPYTGGQGSLDGEEGS